MKTAEIRQAFLDYFERNGHQKVISSSLVPVNDPTLLFTNAGMNQFKDVFLGREHKSYKRATSAQRCVRAGGKHNDLENVGYTARHHTFFEMLGNFSFGDYFKREAISFAWGFLTKELKLPEERLWVTVYEKDQEAEAIWLKEVGVSAERFSRLGDKDNFWSMGDTGPCGPCTEIFYDHGADIAGDPPGGVNDDGDRYIEIWNLVFMQFNRTSSGEMQPLPKPSVDTGMGLERVAAIMQGVHSNYEIDLFQSLLKSISTLFGGVKTTNTSLRVIADHIRSCAFLIADGVTPSNEGRGFTLRRIIRRAVRHGNSLGAKEPFFYKLVTPLILVMDGVCDELASARNHVANVLLQEEEQFAKTLDKGMGLLEQHLASLSGKVISGKTVFTLYDTYGFPVDLTNDIARERGLTLDYDGYEKQMEAQRARARASSKFGVDYNHSLQVKDQTEFLGYNLLEQECVVTAIFVDGSPAEIVENQEAIIVLKKTPFYAESGGQAGDIGVLQWDEGEFQVTDTRKEGNTFLHIGKVVKGKLLLNNKVMAIVNKVSREATTLNHSATHLLHAALREVLGNHVAQKGSLVNANGLRFDFSHPRAITLDELRKVQRRVNEQIRANTEVITDITDLAHAKAKGAMALFGEKYGDRVRVLSMGKDDFSVELCGGTHVKRTGNIGTLYITSESGISAGVRRIEAKTGFQAEQLYEAENDCLSEVSALLNTAKTTIVSKVKVSLAKVKLLEKELEKLKSKVAVEAGNKLINQAVSVKGVQVLAAEISGADRKSLIESVDQLKNKLGNAVVLLAGVESDRVVLVAGVTKNLSLTLKAGDLIKTVSEQLGGKGGGRPDLAQGGGTDISALPSALNGVKLWVEKNYNL